MLKGLKHYQNKPFCGASKLNFEAHIRTNLETEEQAKEWVRELSEQCKCTYRVTHTYKPALKRVTYKIDLQFRKKLTKKQLSLKPKKAETLFSGVHCKKTQTQCPSTLKKSTFRSHPNVRWEPAVHIKHISITTTPLSQPMCLGSDQQLKRPKMSMQDFFPLATLHHPPTITMKRKFCRDQGRVVCRQCPNVQWVHRSIRDGE